jgi:MFS family permease
MELKVKQRIALSTFYFLSGFGFATWTSRIPTLKTILDLNEAELGSILLVMPLSSIIGLPLSGYLVSRFETRQPMYLFFCLYVAALFSISFTTNIVALTISIFLVAFFLRVVNISMNTQSITLQKSFDKKINGSFHALWSFGGIVGVGFTTITILFDWSMLIHFLAFAVIAIIGSTVDLNIYWEVTDLNPEINSF